MKCPPRHLHVRCWPKAVPHMKTPAIDDPKPKRENLGPPGPAKVSGGDTSKGEESNTAGSALSGEHGTGSELEKTIDRKRTQTQPD